MCQNVGSSQFWTYETGFGDTAQFTKLQPNIGVMDILVCTRQIQTESLSS